MKVKDVIEKIELKRNYTTIITMLEMYKDEELIGYYNCSLGFLFLFKGKKGYFSFIHNNLNDSWHELKRIELIDCIKILRKEGTIFNPELYTDMEKKEMLKQI